MEAITILATGLVAWTARHWFLTFLILWGFRGIHLHFGSEKKEKKEEEDGKERT